MKFSHAIRQFSAVLLLGLASLPHAYAQAPACPVKVGGILPLTGSMAPITKKIAQAAELASNTLTKAVASRAARYSSFCAMTKGSPRSASMPPNIWSKSNASPPSPVRFLPASPARSLPL